MSGDPQRIMVSSRSGRVHVVARPRHDVVVRGGDSTTDAAGVLTVDGGPSDRVEIECPEGTHVTVGASSGRVVLDGSFGDVRVTTSSGRVEIGRAVSVDVRSASGAVVVDDCAGECRVVATSGRIEVGRAGSLVADNGSGRVVAGRVGGAVVHTGSGRIRIGADASSSLTVRSVSGAVEVDLPVGSTPAVHVVSTSGRTRSECAPGTDGAVDIETVTGRIDVRCR
ncbi:MAG TPA: DUF4097 family beta strand repeat-containing protein [Acidimicrobiia bacterium]|nr:DUF4097 family beta strand repeat-containing protein [Acidimicrobiia bacterium]